MMEAAVKRVVLDLLKTTALGKYVRTGDLDPSKVRLSIKNGENKKKRLRVDFFQGVRLDADALNRDIAEAEEEDRGDDQAIAEAVASASGAAPASAISPGAPAAAAPLDAMSAGVSSRGDHLHANRDSSVTGTQAGASSLGGATATSPPYQTTSCTHPQSWLHEDWSINWNMSQYRRKQQGLEIGLEGDNWGGRSVPFADKDDPLGFLGPTFLDAFRRMGVRVSSGKIFRIRMEATWEDRGGGILGLLNGLMSAPIAIKVEGVKLIITPRETKKDRSRLGNLLSLAGTTSSSGQHPASSGDIASRFLSGGGAGDDIGGSSHHGGGSYAGGSHVGATLKRGASSRFLGFFDSPAAPGHLSVTRHGGSRSRHHSGASASSLHRRTHGAAYPLPLASIRNKGSGISVLPSSGVLPTPAAQPKKAATSAFGLGALTGIFGREKLKARRDRELECVSKRRRRVLEKLDSRRRHGEEKLRRGPWGWLGASGLDDFSSDDWKFAKKEALGWKAFRQNFGKRAAENVVLEVEGVNVQVVVQRQDGGVAGKKKRKKQRGKSESTGGGWNPFSGSGAGAFSGDERLTGEDGEQERQDCFTAGIVLDMLSIHDTDANGNRVYDESDKDDNANEFIFKSLKFSGLGLYMEEGGSEALDSGNKEKVESAEPPPDDEDEALFSESLAVSAWRKHGDGYSMHRRYVINPLSFEAAYRQKKCKDRRESSRSMKADCTEEATPNGQFQDDPNYLLFSQMSHLSAVLSKQQLGLANEMTEALLLSSMESSSRVSSSSNLHPIFPEYRPACSLTALTAGEWWKYAIRSTMRLNSRSQETSSAGGWTMWFDFMDAFRKRRRYLSLHRRYCWSERPMGMDKKAWTGADPPWGGPLSSSELGEMRDIESDRSISVEALVLWRAQAESDVRHVCEKGNGIGKEAVVDGTKLGATEAASGKGILGLFRSGGSAVNDSDGDEVHAIHPPSKEDISTLRLELEACFPSKVSNKPRMHHGQKSTAEAELSIGFVVLDLVQANLSLVAKVRLGPIETSYHIREDASYSLSFTLSSLQVEDQTSMGDLAFPSIVRSVHDIRSSHLQDEDATFDGTIDTGISGVTGNSGVSQDPAPAPAIYLALATVPSRKLKDISTSVYEGTAVVRTTSFEVVFSPSFLRGMSSFFSLRPALARDSFHLSSSQDDGKEDTTVEVMGSPNTSILYVLALNAHAKNLVRFSDASAAAFSQLDEAGQCRQTKWSLDFLFGSPVLIFPPHADDSHEIPPTSFSSSGGSNNSSSSKALAVRLGHQRLISTDSSVPMQDVSDYNFKRNEASGVMQQWLSDVSASSVENQSLIVDRWTLEITGAAVALGPPLAGEWLRRIDEMNATSQEKDEGMRRTEQTNADYNGLDVLVLPFSLCTEIGTCVSSKESEGDSSKELNRLVWLQCSMSPVGVKCKPVDVISALSNVEHWKQAWNEVHWKESYDEMVWGHENIGIHENWEFEVPVLDDDRFFSLMGSSALPTLIHNALHLSGSLERLSVELESGQHGQFELRVANLSLSHSAGCLGSFSSEGVFNLDEFWLWHQSKASGRRLLLSPTVQRAPGHSSLLESFNSTGSQSNSDCHGSDATVEDRKSTLSIPLLHGRWSISRGPDKDVTPLATSENGGPDVGVCTSLHLSVGDATLHWHIGIVESLKDVWKEVVAKTNAAEIPGLSHTTALHHSGRGGLDLIEDDDQSQSSVSTSSSLLESTFTRAQGSWFVRWLFPIWGIVRDAVFIPSPEVLASVHINLNSAELVMHLEKAQEKDPQFLTASAKDALCKIGVQGQNEMIVSFELGKLSVERSLTYRVRSENRCLFRSNDSFMEPSQRFLVASYTRKASTASADMHDPNTFRTRATTMIQILPSRIVYVGEHIALLTKFIELAGFNALFSPSTGSFVRMLQLDTVEQELQCTMSDLVVDIPEAAHSLNKLVVRVNDLVARHMRIPFSGGGEGKLDLRGVTSDFNDGHKLFDQPTTLSIDMILSPVDDSGNHQVMKVEVYLPELAVTLIRSHYDQILSTILGNLSAPKAGNEIMREDTLACDGTTKNNTRDPKSDTTRHITMKLEINLNSERISLNLRNDGESIGPVGHVRCEGGKMLLQSIPANSYFQIDGNAESIVIEDGSDSETTSHPILSKLESRGSESDSSRMLLIHYEKNSDDSDEFSITFGDCRAMICPSFLDKVVFFFDVPSAEQRRARSKHAISSGETPGSKSTTKLRTGIFRLLFEGPEKNQNMYAVEGHYDADYAVRRSSSGTTEGVDVQANCSPLSFYKLRNTDDIDPVYMLEPATISVMASSTHYESNSEEEMKLIALSPISLNISIQDAVFLQALCWFLSDFFLNVINGMSAGSFLHARKLSGVPGSASDLDQSSLPEVSAVGEATFSDLEFLSEQNESTNHDEEAQMSQPRNNLLPMSVQFSLILPNLTALIRDSPSEVHSLFKFTGENIFCDGHLMTRSYGDVHSSLLFPATFQLRSTLGCKIFDAKLSQWKDFVSRCDMSFYAKQEKRPEANNEARFMIKSRIEFQPFTVCLSNLAVSHLSLLGQDSLCQSSAQLEQHSFLIAEGSDTLNWVDRFVKDIIIFSLRIPCFDISVLDSAKTEASDELVTILRLEDVRSEHIQLLCASCGNDTECKDRTDSRHSSSNSRFVGTVRAIRAITGDESSTNIECCPYGSDALKVSVFSQKRANSGEIFVDDAEIIIASTDPVNRVVVNTTDAFIMRLSDTFQDFLQILSAPHSKKKPSGNQNEEQEHSELYHVRRIRVNPVQLKVNIKLNERGYTGKGKDSPLYVYLKKLSRNSESDTEMSSSELSVENVTGSRFVALSFLYREYASRLNAANASDAAEITEEDLLRERQGNIPTVVFVDDAESSSKLAHNAAMDEFRTVLKQLDQAAASLVTDGDAPVKEEAKPLQKLGHMFRSSFRTPKR